MAILNPIIRKRKNPISKNHLLNSIEQTKVIEIEIPEYTVIEVTNLIGGGKFADILIPTLSMDTPFEERSEIAYAIAKKERVKSLAIYSTEDAYKAAYSYSFSNEHPEASNGQLGSISMDTGIFGE